MGNSWLQWKDVERRAALRRYPSLRHQIRTPAYFTDQTSAPAIKKRTIALGLLYPQQDLSPVSFQKRHTKFWIFCTRSTASHHWRHLSLVWDPANGPGIPHLRVKSRARSKQTRPRGVLERYTNLCVTKWCTTWPRRYGTRRVVLLWERDHVLTRRFPRPGILCDFSAKICHNGYSAASCRS